MNMFDRILLNTKDDRNIESAITLVSADIEQLGLVKRVKKKDDTEDTENYH